MEALAESSKAWSQVELEHQRVQLARTSGEEQDFKVDRETFEATPRRHRPDADHGIADGCGIQVPWAAIPQSAQIWVKHLREQWDADAWENGEGYQPEA